MRPILMIVFFLLFSLGSLAQNLNPKTNLIINGDVVLDQRNSAAVITCANGITTYGPDRFACYEDAATGATNIRQVTLTSSDAPYLAGIRYSVKTLATTGITIAATSFANMYYVVEGYDFSTIANKYATLSFWVRAKKTGAACVTFSGGQTLVKQYTINSADTWQEVTMTVDFKTGTSSGSWNYTNGAGVNVVFAGSVGTNHDDATDNVWIGTTEQGTAACGSNNLLAAANDYLEVTGVRLTEGTQKVPFVRAGGGSIAAELNLAKRYFQKSYPFTTAPGTNTGDGLMEHMDPATSATSTWGLHVPFPVEMRDTPTITTYRRDGSGVNPTYWSYGISQTYAAITITGASKQGFYPYFNTTASGLTADVGILVRGHWTANAEL